LPILFWQSTKTRRKIAVASWRDWNPQAKLAADASKRTIGGLIVSDPPASVLLVRGGLCMNSMPSDVLIFGIVIFVIGGVLAMKGVIKDDAEKAPASHVPVQASLRRSLPRHGICPVGVALMVVGAVCVIGSYFVRL
jgi:hypothetical protein